MAGFTKLCSTIITSSVWSEDDKTRIMWVTMLAMASAKGRVDGSVPGMAAVARMSLEDAQRSIDKLCQPDPYSRTKDMDGRRIVPIDGGWKIVNHQKYRLECRDSEDRREYQREWDRTHRGKKSDQSDQNPTPSDTIRQQTTEAEAEAEKNTTTTIAREASEFRDGCRECIAVWNAFAESEHRCAVEGYPAVDLAFSALVNSYPPIGFDEIKGCMENYRLALGLDKSQAYEWSLGQFLRRETISKFRPGTFNLKNYDKTRFEDRRGPPAEKPFDAEATYERLKSKGLL